MFELVGSLRLPINLCTLDAFLYSACQTDRQREGLTDLVAQRSVSVSMECGVPLGFRGFYRWWLEWLRFWVGIALWPLMIVCANTHSMENHSSHRNPSSLSTVLPSWHVGDALP